MADELLRVALFQKKPLHRFISLGITHRISHRHFHKGILPWCNGIDKKKRKVIIRVCLKTHCSNLHVPLRSIFAPNSVGVAHYAAFI
ncbi:DUF6783 domain-containing protein [Lacrimispora xylanolytica]